MTTPQQLERDSRASSLIVKLVTVAVRAEPERRETLLRRAERLAALRRRFWTPERMRIAANG